MNKKLTGLFIGTAVGDAMGLSREGLSPKRARRLFGMSIRPNLVVIPFMTRFNVCSDDTEHLWMTAKALLESKNKDVDAFEKSLSRYMRCWMLSLPVGAGKATLKACFKLWVGVSEKKSGIFSAGNGAVMRAPVIGAYYANNAEKMIAVLKASTCMTHTDPKAYEGALVIAKAAALLVEHSPQQAPVDLFFREVCPLLKGEELQKFLTIARFCLDQNKSLDEFLECLHIGKKGVSGYVNHTVPAVVYAWLRFYGDYRKTIEALIHAGGDTDTSAAIAGALAGITAGKENIPDDWLKGVCNAPMSMNKLEELANALACDSFQGVPKINFLFLLIRNLFLLVVVLVHGFRRLFPPY